MERDDLVQKLEGLEVDLSRIRATMLSNLMGGKDIAYDIQVKQRVVRRVAEFLRDEVSHHEAEMFAAATLADDPFTDEISSVEGAVNYLKALLADAREGHLPVAAPRPAAAAIGHMAPASNITIVIEKATVGTLNLGTIVGDIQTNVNHLRSEGHDQVAAALHNLAEAIGNCDVLGDRRKDALEQVAAISAEAERPPAQRHLGVVKPIMRGLGVTLGTIADLKAVWDVAWPPIKAYFGLP